MVGKLTIEELKGLVASGDIDTVLVVQADMQGRLMGERFHAAISAFDQSTMLRSAFGDDMVDHHVHAPNWEQFETDRRVTDWELRRGFEGA